MMNKACSGCSHLTAANHESIVGRTGHQSGRMIGTTGLLCLQRECRLRQDTIQSLIAAPRCFSRPTARDHVSYRDKRFECQPHVDTRKCIELRCLRLRLNSFNIRISWITLNVMKYKMRSAFPSAFYLWIGPNS